MAGERTEEGRESKQKIGRHYYMERAGKAGRAGRAGRAGGSAGRAEGVRALTGGCKNVLLKWEGRREERKLEAVKLYY